MDAIVAVVVAVVFAVTADDCVVARFVVVKNTDEDGPPKKNPLLVLLGDVEVELVVAIPVGDDGVRDESR